MNKFEIKNNAIQLLYWYSTGIVQFHRNYICISFRWIAFQ